jgi:hypothetical protein
MVLVPERLGPHFAFHTPHTTHADFHCSPIVTKTQEKTQTWATVPAKPTTPVYQPEVPEAPKQPEVPVYKPEVIQLQESKTTRISC